MPVFDPARDATNRLYLMDRINRWNGVESSVYDSTRQVKTGGGYDGAGDAKDGFIDVTERSTHFLAKAVGAYENIGSWKNGHGDRQRYGYDRNRQQFVLGWVPEAGKSLIMAGLRDRIDDNLTTLRTREVRSGITLARGDGVDLIRTGSLLGRVVYRQDHPSDNINTVQIEAGAAMLDIDADNFTHRPPTKDNRSHTQGKMASRKYFGKATIGFDLMQVAARIGAGVDYTNTDGTLFGGTFMYDLSQKSSHGFPDVDFFTTKLEGEAAYDLSDDGHLLAAVTYEYVQASADQLYDITRTGNCAIDRRKYFLTKVLDCVPGTRRKVPATAQKLYEEYYGANLDNDSADHNISVKLDYTHEFLDDRMAVTGSVGRLMRSGNVLEKYTALSATDTNPVYNSLGIGTTAKTAGNPQIRPEVHHQVTLGWRYQGEDWTRFASPRSGPDAWALSLHGRYDRIKDFISRDRARGQAGVRRSDHAAIYRNVDADRAGIEADAQWNLTPNIATRAHLAFDWGHNRTDGRALYGVAPFEADVLVDYHDDLSTVGTWHTGAKLRLVSAQGRTDADPATGSAYDRKERTNGYSVLGLYLGAQLRDRVSLTAGVDNVFDRRYSVHHLRSVFTGSSTPKAIDAPGRTVFVRATASF